MGVFSGGMFSQMGAPDEAQAASGALVGVGFWSNDLRVPHVDFRTAADRGGVGIIQP
ncbi:MAG: hypothetical protein U0528_13335 [Anaerolineae bacterium]